MVNLMGNIWIRKQGPLNIAGALAVPQSHLHLYGKLEARDNRKMGHITVVADTPELAAVRAVQSRAALER
jgi:5-(carboxyamino)imidazole ribonucleotide synthase